MIETIRSGPIVACDRPTGVERVMAESLVLAAGLEPIAGYTLVRLLGRGGFGEVWDARAPGDFHIALKFLRLETREAGAEQPALEVIRNIRHVHLLDVQFATRVGDRLVIAMPLCDQTLLDRLHACEAEGKPGVPRNELLRYMDELARAVDYLNEPRHRAEDGSLVGVQHRDIKPQNIFLVGGSVRLADFGLAKILSATVATTQGSMTASYAAPEVIQGQFSRWSDQYSLAASYCELRTGRPPFEGDNALQVIYAHVHRTPELPGIPDAERNAVARALAKKPAERWATCREFVRALIAAAREDHQRGTTPATMPVPPAAAATKLVETQVPPPIEPTPASAEPAKAVTNSVGMNLVLIPAGSFLMGSPDSDQDAQGNEKPQHPVRITRPFYLGVTEVTQEQYEAVIGRNPSWFSASGGGKDSVAGQDTGEHPVENVSWNDAIEFCNKLSAREGLKRYYSSGGVVLPDGDGYRLPTEAEWEYACRAGSESRYSYGDDPAKLGEHAWFDANADGKTHPVRQKSVNLWGLYDMHGNVWEWCWDGYQGDYYNASPAADHPGQSRAADRVHRGGGWFSLPRFCRSAHRIRSSPGYRFDYLGLRVARAQSGR
jgi:formylglycine-generating enzyme required for sulfatase activity